jgi:hypothetical protein
MVNCILKSSRRNFGLGQVNIIYHLLFIWIYIDCNLKFPNNILETVYDNMRSANQAAQTMMNLSSGASSASSAILDSAGVQNLYLYNQNDGNQEDEEGVYSQEGGSQEERGSQEECSSQECSQKGPQEGGSQEGGPQEGGSQEECSQECSQKGPQKGGSQEECSRKGPQEGGSQEGDSLKGGSLKGGLLKGDAQILKDLNSSLNLSNSSK